MYNDDSQGGTESSDYAVNCEDFQETITHSQGQSQERDMNTTPNGAADTSSNTEMSAAIARAVHQCIVCNKIFVSLKGSFTPYFSCKNSSFRPSTTCRHTHRPKAVCVRHLRQGIPLQVELVRASLCALGLHTTPVPFLRQNLSTQGQSKETSQDARQYAR